MKQVADGVWRLSQWPRPVINVYLVDDVLIDAGRRTDRRRIFRQLERRELSLLALTHVHPDHQGVAKNICDARGIPLACHIDDVDAMEGRRLASAGTDLASRLIVRFWEGPPHPVARPLRAGDEVAGFRVVHAPGHSPGEVIFFRDADRVAICGDVIRNLSYLTMRSVLKEPPEAFNDDTAENRRSIRKLAELRPALILPGHGAAVTDMAEFERFVESVPTSEQPPRTHRQPSDGARGHAGARNRRRREAFRLSAAQLIVQRKRSPRLVITGELSRCRRTSSDRSGACKKSGATLSLLETDARRRALPVRRPSSSFDRIVPFCT